MGQVAIHIAKPFNGRPATAGNGMMPALRANSRAKVDEVHAASLANGGIDEGKPGIRGLHRRLLCRVPSRSSGEQDRRFL
jgi:hypothetical protein